MWTVWQSPGGWPWTSASAPRASTASAEPRRRSPRCSVSTAPPATLVRYPDRASFSRMVADPDYQRVTHLRTRALREAVLQATTEWPA